MCIGRAWRWPVVAISVETVLLFQVKSSIRDYNFEIIDNIAVTISSNVMLLHCQNTIRFFFLGMLSRDGMYGQQIRPSHDSSYPKSWRMEDEGESCVSVSLSQSNMQRTRSVENHCGSSKPLSTAENTTCKLLKHLIKQRSNVKLVETCCVPCFRVNIVLVWRREFITDCA